MPDLSRSILYLICLAALFPASFVKAQEKQCVNQMDRWSSGNENNLSGAVKSVSVEEQIYEFESHFIYPHDKPLLKERFEFDRQGRKIEHYTYTIDGRESPKSVSVYNEKNWLIKDDTFSALSNKPYLQTRYTYDEFGNVKEIAQYNVEDNRLVQKWVFTNDLQKKYFEFADFDSRNKQRMRVGFKRDEKCRLAEIFAYQPDGKLGVKSVISFDKNNIPISVVNYSSENIAIGKRKYEYELDGQGNWKKKSDFEWQEKGEKSDWKLMNVVYRKIEYYDSK
ncbi:MAG TPA: hypothetical protein VF571_08085 [Pyrinomonadaceae bacterium]|jgi:hypothetical protein